ncbi:hypothetical protein GCM10023339_43940 [Alloalcanivorax gelatiniphagus]
MTTAGPELPAAPCTLEELFTETVPAPLLLLVVGPAPPDVADAARFATTDPVDLVAAGHELFRRGHVPLVAEAVVLPLADAAGSGDASSAGVPDDTHAFARRLLGHCDGIVRVGGASAGADELAALAAARGARVWASVDAVPHVAGTHPV